MTKKKKRKLRIGRIIIFLIVFLALAFALALAAKHLFKQSTKINNKEGYVASSNIEVPLYDLEYNEIEKIIRGTKIKYKDELIDEKYYKLADKETYILKENITDKYEDVVTEKEK